MPSSSSIPPSASLLDTPLHLLGSGHWREALRSGLPQLEALAQLPASLRLPSCLQGVESSPVGLQTIKIRLQHQETIGMDLQASVQVVQGSDGSATLRSSFMPLRVRHTFDGFLEWQDQDGYSILTQDGSLLVPETDAQVRGQSGGLWQTWWTVSCPEDMPEVVGAESDQGTLLAGVEFHHTSDRLIFRIHPDILFPDGFIRLLTWQPDLDQASFSTGLDGSSRVLSAVSACQRRGPTVARLQDLADALLATTVSPITGVIQSVIQLPTGCRYVLDTGDVLVRRDHEYLEVGATIAAGQVVGRQLELHQQGQQGSDWWRNLDLSSGLSLDTICPVPGLTMPAGPVRVTSYSDSGVIRVHVWPEGQPEAVERYQAWCQSSSRRLPESRGLAAALGMGTAGLTQYPDGLGLLFRLQLGSSAVVARHTPDVPRRVLQALQEFCPLSAVLLFHRTPVVA